MIRPSYATSQSSVAGTNDEDDSEDFILPTWKWSFESVVHDPWYGNRPHSRRSKQSYSFVRRGIAAISVCDLVLILILLFALILFKESSSAGSCNLIKADTAFFRKSVMRCQALVAHLKKSARSHSWMKLSSCNASASSVAAFFNYTSGQPCPNFPSFTESLLFQDRCHDLTRRTCRARCPPEFKEEALAAESRWSQGIDQNVIWNDSYCDGYKCLMKKGRSRGCPNCFDFKKEKSTSWAANHRFDIIDVLNLKPPGVIRIGLDVSGGDGDFAARMMDKGVTIITQNSNSGIPRMETLSQRGLPSLHLPINARLPFFDGTLDLIHYSNSNKVLTVDPHEWEETLFEWDRVMRTHGLLWLDSIPIHAAQYDELLTLFDLFGYRKLLWEVGKVRGTILVAVVLEKPRRQLTHKDDPLATMS